MFRKLICAALLLFIVQLCHSQNDETNGDAPVKGDMSKFLDNGKIGNVKNMIRLRMNRVIAGYFGLSYERKFTRKFGLEVGAYAKPTPGYIFNNSARQLFANRDGEISPGKTTGGICFMAYPKLYLTGKFLNNGYYIGLRNYYATYNAEITTTHLSGINIVSAQSTSTFFMFGSHQNFKKCYAFGVEAGFGYFKDSYKGVTFANYVGGSTPTTAYKKDTSFSGINMSLDIIFGFLF